jgi:tripartite-type tricarboxylate transporter receptor subunit TctC
MAGDKHTRRAVIVPRSLLTTLAPAFALASAFACAQEFPARPIRLVTAEPGGGVDFAARLIARSLSSDLGQQVIVDNRGGASGVIAAGIVARAPADGYTLLFYGSALWLLPYMRGNLPYDAVKDFAPVTLAVSSPNIVVVHPSVAASSIQELIALAKAHPGSLNYASGSTGSSNHLAAELFKSMAGVDIVRVTYKGAGAALNDMISGQTQVMFPNAAAVLPHVKSGRLKALAVTSSKPSQLAPGLPTVASQGLPGYESSAVLNIFAPAKTPSALIELLNHKVVTVLGKPDVREKFLETGSDVVASTPAELSQARKTDMESMGGLIKKLGVQE